MSITRRVSTKRSSCPGGTAAASSVSKPARLDLKRHRGGGGCASRNKSIVVIFQRGGRDGLKHSSSHSRVLYYAMLAELNIPRNAVARSRWFFGADTLRWIPCCLFGTRNIWPSFSAAGSTDTTRSHFDDRAYMDSGTPGRQATEVRWLTGPLQRLPHALLMSPKIRQRFAQCTWVPTLPRIISGSEDSGGGEPTLTTSASAAAIQKLHLLLTLLIPCTRLGGNGCKGEGAKKKRTPHRQETFDAVNMLKSDAHQKYKPTPRGPTINKGRFGGQPAELAHSSNRT